MAYENEIVIYDTEYWTDRGTLERYWSGLDDFPPLLMQIGAFRMRLEQDWPIVDELLAYVRPVDASGREAPVTEFFTELTNITTADIEQKGQSLQSAIGEFAAFAGDFHMYSYGNDMFSTILPSCFLRRLDCPFDPQKSHNIKRVLARAGMSEKDFKENTSGTLAAHFGIELEGHHVHDARDDARSIAVSLRHLHNVGKLKAEWLLNP